MISFGSNKIKDIFFGNDRIVEVYKGSVLYYKIFAIPSYYVLATDSDFQKYTASTVGTYFKYIGSDEYVIIPDKIQNIVTTNTYEMFSGNTTVKGVASHNTNITNMSAMFFNFGGDSLDLYLDTSKVTDMSYMFWNANIITLDISSFNVDLVENVSSMFREARMTDLNIQLLAFPQARNMSYMFYKTRVTNGVDLSSINTPPATIKGSRTTEYMFNNAQIGDILDLSSFPASTASSMDRMFARCTATIGYAKTQSDADNFNATTGKPSTLTFIVKP